jgi:hypothetical protein
MPMTHVHTRSQHLRCSASENTTACKTHTHSFTHRHTHTHTHTHANTDTHTHTGRSTCIALPLGTHRGNQPTTCNEIRGENVQRPCPTCTSTWPRSIKMHCIQRRNIPDDQTVSYQLVCSSMCFVDRTRAIPMASNDYNYHSCACFAQPPPNSSKDRTARPIIPELNFCVPHKEDVPGL